VKTIFTYNDVTLEYLSLGAGTEVVVCLHGFGREAEDFVAFQSLLQPGQRLIAINLLAHGKSTFPASRISRRPLTKTEWCSLIAALLNDAQVERYHLIGYSMGGRLAMVLVEQMAERIKSLVLMAPDGLKVNWIYRFVSDTKLGRILYRSIIRNPSWLLKTVDFLRAIRILHDKIHRFVHLQLETEEKRRLVYDAWLIHRMLFPHLKEVARSIECRHTPFLLMFGRYDKVIPAKDGRRLLRHFRNKRQPVLLDLGHRLLHPKAVQFIQTSNMWMPYSEE
jgi:pimeloyl-ACP methyl ester carboxylesterase